MAESIDRLSGRLEIKSRKAILPVDYAFVNRLTKVKRVLNSQNAPVNRSSLKP